MIRLGIFDSGLGGLGVYKEIKKMIPDLETFYYSDAAFCPYGPKPLDVVQERCRVITKNLLEKKVDLIVVACNTATTLAINSLREEFSQQISFVGIEPFINFIRHDISSQYPSNSPALLLTVNTSLSERFKKLREEFDPDGLMTVYPLPTLASFIEENIHLKKTPWFRQELDKIISPLKNKGHDCLILGCTHYPFIAQELEQILGAKTISPEHFVALRVIELLKAENKTTYSLPANKKTNFFCHFHFESSGPCESLKEKLDIIFETE